MSIRFKARLMELMTVKELTEVMSGTRTVIIPLGITEQHGYHLPLVTDVFNAVELAKRTSEITGCVVAPPLNYAFSGGTLVGTINIMPSTVSALIYDICRSLVVQGFKNLVLLLGHGGTENTQAVRSAADMFLRNSCECTDVRLALVEFGELCASISNAFLERDYHAGYVETSLMMYWHPEAVRDEIIMDDEELAEMMRIDPDKYLIGEKPLDHPFIVPRYKQHPNIKVGVMGYPERASKELGKRICDEAVGNLVELITAMEHHKIDKEEFQNGGN